MTNLNLKNIMEILKKFAEGKNHLSIKGHVSSSSGESDIVVRLPKEGELERLTKESSEELKKVYDDPCYLREMFQHLTEDVSDAQIKDMANRISLYATYKQHRKEVWGEVEEVELAKTGSGLSKEGEFESDHVYKDPNGGYKLVDVILVFRDWKGSTVKVFTTPKAKLRRAFDLLVPYRYVIPLLGLSNVEKIELI